MLFYRFIKYTLLMACIYAFGLAVTQPVAAASFTALGDLPGGSIESYATGVSSDGSVVSGWSISASGNEAFRWTQTSGMVGLGDLPGGNFNSKASGITSDGSMIMGWSTSTSGKEAFRWTQTSGMVGLGDLQGGSDLS